MDIEQILIQEQYRGRYGPLKAAIDEADFLANSEADLDGQGMRAAVAVVRDLVAEFLVGQHLATRLAVGDPKADRLHHPYHYEGVPAWTEGGPDDLFEVFQAAWVRAVGRDYAAAHEAFRECMEKYAPRLHVSPTNVSMMKGYMHQEDAREMVVDLVEALGGVPRKKAADHGQ